MYPMYCPWSFNAARRAGDSRILCALRPRPPLDGGSGGLKRRGARRDKCLEPPEYPGRFTSATGGSLPRERSPQGRAGGVAVARTSGSDAERSRVRGPGLEASASELAAEAEPIVLGHTHARDRQEAAVRPGDVRPARTTVCALLPLVGHRLWTLETEAELGDVAFRQHKGGHTAGPNWPTFLEWAERYLKTR